MTSILLVPVLAALTTTTSPLLTEFGGPAATPIAQSIHDIVPPRDVLSYPLWMVIVAAVFATLVVALIIWWLVGRMRRPSAPQLPSPVVVAMRRLEELRGRARETEPYEFSVAVSDVLRTFVNDAKFRLPATRQTSSEFLAAIANAPLFTGDDRSLLSHFLGKCDLIKFARVQANAEDNAELVESALAFVKGGQS